MPNDISLHNQQTLLAPYSSAPGGAAGFGTAGRDAATATRQALGIGIGGFGNIQQKRQQQLQTQGMAQQLSQRKRILQLLLGNFGSGGNQDALTQSLLGQIDQSGAGQRAVTEQNFQNVANSATARFAQYGVGGSSGVASVMSGIERQKALALGVQNDQILAQKIGVQERAADRSMQTQQIIASLLG